MTNKRVNNHLSVCTGEYSFCTQVGRRSQAKFLIGSDSGSPLLSVKTFQSDARQHIMIVSLHVCCVFCGGEI